MSYLASKYVRFITGIKVHDTTAGFICYRRNVLQTINLDQIKFTGYAFQIEMKYSAWKIGFKIVEIFHLYGSNSWRIENEQRNF
jgi:dolichol-phosphate mannosyltransferase